MTIQQQIEVMQHFANGGEVEIETYTGNWIDDHNPQWNWSDYEYRIKQEPKKMAKLYKFAYYSDTFNGWVDSNFYARNEERFYSRLGYNKPTKVIRLDNTMIEVPL